MKIAAVAAGAVGGYYGSRLAAAGHDVHFLARGANLQALRERGLQIHSPLGDFHLREVNASDDAAAVGPVDVVLFAVKLWDTEKAARSIEPLMGPDTRVVTLQNGVDSVERLAPILGEDRVVGGVTYIATVLEAPGVIRHTSQFAQIRCGRENGARDFALAAFVDAGQRAGIDIAVADDIVAERWKKFAFLVPLSALTAGTRRPLGEGLANAETRAFFVQAMEEVVAVARAKGVRLPDDFRAERLRFAEAAPKGMMASTAHDLERGNRLELDWLSGKVVALGRELGVPTPANAAVAALLSPYKMGRPDAAAH